MQAFEKISKDEPVACLNAGAIKAVLSYIDFFSTSLQVRENDLAISNFSVFVTWFSYSDDFTRVIDLNIAFVSESRSFYCGEYM